MMGKILVLAEKPDVGRDIAKVLKCAQSGRGGGFLVGSQYVVTWSIGHLIKLCDAVDYDKAYRKWSMDTLPIIPRQMQIKVTRDTNPDRRLEKQFYIIKSLMNDNQISEIICATDAGREGELIFRYIYTMAGCKKKFKRLWISSLTESAILKGLENLKSGADYDLLYHSALCRSYADWLVGISITRAYSVKYGATLSIGRVQTPTLALVVDKKKEIDSFKSKDYWEIQAVYDKGFTGQWFNKDTKESRLYDKSRAYDIAAKLKNNTGVVTDITEDKIKDPHPLLYDLTELQQEANRKYGYTAQETLDIAQKLYEQRKYITYPRTDSRYLTEDIKNELPQIIEKLQVGLYRKTAGYILSQDHLRLTDRVIDSREVTDHHAIIPTLVQPNLDSLSEEEEKIYDLIIRRFLCVFYPHYEYTVKTIEVNCKDDEYFLSRGKTVNKLGWMKCYVDTEESEEKEDDDKKVGSIREQILPEVSAGEIIKLVDVRVQANKTRPPSFYTDASLLAAMANAGRFVESKELKVKLKEVKGIGTKATRAKIIENLIESEYLKRKNKYLIPTDKGIKLIEIVHDELKSPEMTAQWELALSQVSEGKMGMSIFMGCITDFLKQIVEEIKYSEAKPVEFEKTRPKYVQRR